MVFFFVNEDGRYIADPQSLRGEGDKDHVYS